MKKFKITVNGTAYEVQAEVINETPVMSGPAAGATQAPMPVAAVSAVAATPTAAAATTSAPKSSGAAGEIPSPLAGKVVSLDAAVGTSVNEGDKVMTLEAMKMNTFVTAPKSGTIKEICVKAGDAVEEGALLARID